MPFLSLEDLLYPGVKSMSALQADSLLVDPTGKPHSIFYYLRSSSFLKIFIYLAALNLSCVMWDLVPGPGIEPGAPGLGAQNLSHRTTRELLRSSSCILAFTCPFISASDGCPCPTVFCD